MNNIWNYLVNYEKEIKTQFSSLDFFFEIMHGNGKINANYGFEDTEDYVTISKKEDRSIEVDMFFWEEGVYGEEKIYFNDPFKEVKVILFLEKLLR